MGIVDYMNMPFDKLFHIVFTNSGRIKICKLDAYRAMMKRLEKAFNIFDIFGDIESGQINVQEAYTAADWLLCKNEVCA